VRAAVAAMPEEKSCGCGDALKYAILTDRKAIPAATREKLAVLLDKYLS
jgi:5'-methylthioadenosine phosphorylase